jgi:hypothetical protein
VSGPGDAEGPAVEGCDRGEHQAFCTDQAGLGAAEAEVGVGLDQIGDPARVGGRDRLDLALAVGHGPEEPRFRGGAELATDQVAVSATTSRWTLTHAHRARTSKQKKPLSRQ